MSLYIYIYIYSYTCVLTYILLIVDMHSQQKIQVGIECAERNLYGTQVYAWMYI